MGVPFEALIPYGIIIGMFGVTGAGLSIAKYYANEHKRARWNMDAWDRQSMYSLVTLGMACAASCLRGQSGNAEAPKGFEVNNPWKVERRII
ncbi:hypothetical protein VTN49DRAFT_605 [Thermomyces lanuginosus]|uniref:uncharacterized protein n=1 Tax=Thermomyces lanuginosus TaxID=5541 RepID=UPI0037442EA9